MAPARSNLPQLVAPEHGSIAVIVGLGDPRYALATEQNAADSVAAQDRQRAGVAAIVK
jgi:hypothetical protein